MRRTIGIGIGTGMLALLLAGALAQLARPAAAVGTHELGLYTWYCNTGSYSYLTVQQSKDKCQAEGGGLGLFQSTYRLVQGGQVVATKTGGAPIEFPNVADPGATVRVPNPSNYVLRKVFCQDGNGGYAQKLVFWDGPDRFGYRNYGQPYTNCHLFYVAR